MSGGVSTNFYKQNSTGRKLVIDDDQEHKKRSIGCTTKSCYFRLPKKWELTSPMRYLKQIGVRLTAAAAVVVRRGGPPPKSHHMKDRAAAKKSVAPLDSQRAEAINDCIDFINSSSVSSLPRSNSATAHSNPTPHLS